ncbi:Uma2 family endonuclease [Singulisphaera sp. PoT]|uniref:Uma2 family endonuclease n=1 Tax=Singulisphaera sp. PoT TaxID=3411797 RepID=UPI003BF48921
MSTPSAEIVSEATIDMVTHLDVGPGGIDRFLDLVADRRSPLIKYRRGSLTLVSPSRAHERGAERLDGLIKAICAELDIDYQATATTLYRRPDRDSGIVADKTYYLAHEPDVREVEGSIDLAINPPPDLAIEVVVTHDPAKSLAICQELGIPEVWVYWLKRGVLEFLSLDPEGRYEPTPASRSFPFLPAAEVLPWLQTGEAEPDNRWERRLRLWVRTELAPRRG